MTELSEKARTVLSENTGFRSLRVASVERDKDFYKVEVDAMDGADAPGGIVRTYEVMFDAAGSLHGYSLVSYRMPRLRGERIRSRPCN